MCSSHLRLSVDPYCWSTFINLSIDILINVLVDPWSTPDRHSFDTSIDKIDSASILDGVSVKISWHLSNCQLRCWSSQVLAEYQSRCWSRVERGYGSLVDCGCLSIQNPNVRHVLTPHNAWLLEFLGSTNYSNLAIKYQITLFWMHDFNFFLRKSIGTCTKYCFRYR